MSSKKKINMAIVGLGFGAEFIPIYMNHPETVMAAVCQRSEENLNKIADYFQIKKRYTSFDELIADPEVDAVHINSPIHLHAEQSIKALDAGKHVACTVPMATSIDDHLISKHQSPFAIETAHIKMKNSDLSAEVTRSLFNTARAYIESFDVYGSEKSFEWNRIDHENPIVHLGEQAERVKIPDYADWLPEPIRAYTTSGVYSDDNQHLSFTQGSGHGGSHPHMVHAFVEAIMYDLDPFPNAVQAANWTSVGIVAHESAMQGGRLIKLPDFDELK